MIDYAINILISARHLLFLSTALVFASFMVKPRKWKSGLKKSSLVTLGLGLVFGATSPSNTYKNTVDYSPSLEIREIYTKRQEPSSPVIDISRKPMTPEQRAKQQVDMRNRVSPAQAIGQ